MPSLRPSTALAALVSGIADKLGLDSESAIPAWEDPAHWVLKEAELPVNVDPLDSKLEDAEARARIARVFERGLTEPSGYVLPVQRWNAAASRSNWMTEKWKLKRERLFLVPGDSPSAIACRWPPCPMFRRPPTYPYVVSADPGAVPAELPDPQEIEGRIVQRISGSASARPTGPSRWSRC